jgi:hypothetical protein
MLLQNLLHKKLPILALCIVLASTGWAFAQEAVQDLSPLMAMVDPCIVTITLNNQSRGSGFVVDAKGLIVTNYHVIEGAKSATVVFTDKTSYPVEGFVAINQNKDLAILSIRPRNKKLYPLRLTPTPPAKGDRVFAFGSPMGLRGSISEGLISAIRPGADVQETLQDLAHRDVYREVLDYDLDTQWIQTTAPISPGNSGGPLVNVRGQVVGINTWVCAVGQNLNFSLSVTHLQTLLAGSGTTVQSLANLPPARANREVFTKGDPQKTLRMWTELNKYKNELNEKTSAYEKSLQKIVPIDPRNTMKGLTSRNRRKAVIFDQLAKTYAEHAAKVKTLDNNDVDQEASMLSFAEAELAQRLADICQQFSAALETNSSQDIWHNEWELRRLRENIMDLRTGHDLTRVKLARTYEMSFPTLEETAKGIYHGSNDRDNPKKEDKAKNSESSSSEKADLAVFRVWSDRTGRFQVEAKYLGIESGKVRLERRDGRVILIPLETLSEADQRFIGSTP